MCETGREREISSCKNKEYKKAKSFIERGKERGWESEQNREMERYEVGRKRDVERLGEQE